MPPSALVPEESVINGKWDKSDVTSTITAVSTREDGTLQAPLPNPSLQVTADHTIKQVDAPVYDPKEGEVLLHVKATGVCGYVSSLFRRSGMLMLICLALTFIFGSLVVLDRLLLKETAY